MNEFDDKLHPYSRLTPDRILNAIDSTGRETNGRLLALNSYENRVYQVGLDDNSYIVVKFYRPDRWSDAAIHEEHEFTDALNEQEVPVLTPLRDKNNKSLLEFEGFRFAVYRRCGGHAPDLNFVENRIWFGRLLARIHAVGALTSFEHRPSISIQEFGLDASEFLLENQFLPMEYESSYRAISRDLIPLIENRFKLAGEYRSIRLHGDCHAGNVLWTDAGPHFVDFDDSRMGPIIQDFWMLLPSEQAELNRYLEDLLEGYNEFYDFDYRQLHLIEALRTLRIMHYSAWLARRWSDPAFPANFPWFNTPSYWEEHLLSLKEQLALLQEASSEFL